MTNSVQQVLEKNEDYLSFVFKLSKTLEEDVAHQLRTDLSQNDNTPLDVKEVLAKDDDTQIRLNISKSSKVNRKIVLLNLKDRDDNVRLQALKSHAELVEEDDLITAIKDSSDSVSTLARKIFKSRL